MPSELTLRIAPHNRSLEKKIKEVITKEYVILEFVSQKLENESYLYLQLETKDAHRRSTSK